MNSLAPFNSPAYDSTATHNSPPGGNNMILPSTPRSSSPRRLSARRNVPRQWQLPSACILRGYLGKKGGRLRKRWFNNLFLIEDGTLFICWDLTSHFLIESAIPLNNILACNKHKKDETQFILIYHGVKNNKGAWQKCKIDIKCSNRVERDSWVTQLLEMRDTARCLNSDLVDRSKAYEALQSALDEVRRASAQAIMSTIGAALKGSDYRAMDKAFNLLRLKANLARHGVAPDSTDRDSSKKPNRASFSIDSGKPPSPTPRGIPLEGFRAVDHLEGMLKTIYWYRALRMKRLHEGFRRLATKPPPPAVQPSSTLPSARSIAHSMAPSAASMPPGGNFPSNAYNTIFVENLCLTHSEMMARDMVRYRTRKLVSVLDWIYKRRLQFCMTHMTICAKAHEFVTQEKAALLIHLLKHKELKELMDKRFAWNLVRAYKRKCERRETALLQLLEPAVIRQRRFAVRLWYMNCVKMADRDLAAVLKLTSALRKTNLRILLAAFRRIDKHATEKASEEVMQVAQNLTQVNTKILASFHQIPVSRAVVQLCGLIKNFELGRKRIGMNYLVTHVCRYRTLVRLSGAVVATLRNIEARVCVRDPFNALRAHASQRSVQIAQSQLAAGLLEAGTKVKLCGSRSLARCYRQLELKLLEFSMMRFRRFNLARQLGAEQEAFLTHYSRIVKYGQRSASEIFATKLLNWFERQRKMHLMWVWTALIDNWDKQRRLNTAQKIQATTRLTGLIDRWRCVILTGAFQIFKYQTYDLPRTNSLMLESATKAIASAEKIAARIELSKKIEGATKDFTVSELINRQQRHKPPETGLVRVSPLPVQDAALTQLRQELNLMSPYKPWSPMTFDDPGFFNFDNSTVSHHHLGSIQKPGSYRRIDENKHNLDDNLDDPRSSGSVASVLRLADRFLASSDRTTSSHSGDVLPPISSRSEVGGKFLVSQSASKQLAAILADSGCDWSEISDVLGEFDSPSRRRSEIQRRQKRVFISDIDKSLLSTTSETSSLPPLYDDSDLSDLGNRKIAFVKSVTKTAQRPCSPLINNSLSMHNSSVSLGGPPNSSHVPERNTTVVLRARPRNSSYLKKEAIIQY